MAAGIQAWLDTAEAPADLYDLLGSRCLEPDREQLLQRIETGVSQLLPHRNDPNPERARRAVYLLQELHRARDTFSRSSKAMAYDDGLIALISGKCAALPAGLNLSRDELRRRLEQDFRVHSKHLEVVLEAVMSKLDATSQAPGVETHHQPPMAQTGDRAAAHQPVDMPSVPPRESVDRSPTTLKDGPPPARPPLAAPTDATAPAAPTSSHRPPRPAPFSERRAVGSPRHSAGRPPPIPVSSGSRAEPPRTSPRRHDATRQIGEIARRAAPSNIGSGGHAMLWGVSAIAALLLVGGATAVLAVVLLRSKEANRVASAPPQGAPNQVAKTIDSEDVRGALPEPTKTDEPTSEPTKEAQPKTPDKPRQADAARQTPDDSSNAAERPPRPEKKAPAPSAVPPAAGTERTDGSADDVKTPSGSSKKAAEGDPQKPTGGVPAKPLGGDASTVDKPEVPDSSPKADTAAVVLTHAAAATAVAWSPDAKRLATAGIDDVVRIWDGASGKELRRLEGHTGPVNSLSWDPEGKHVASTGDDGTVRIWAVDGDTSETLKGDSPKPLNVVAWRSDGNRLMVGASDGSLWQWMRRFGGPWTSSELKIGLPLGATRSICCDHGKQIQVVSCHGDAAIAVWSGKQASRLIVDGEGKAWGRLAEGKPPQGLKEAIITPANRASSTGLDASDDGTLLAVAAGGDLDIWNIAHKDFNVRLQILPGYQDLKGYRAPDWSPDGKYLAAGVGSGRVVGWEVADGKVQKQRFQFACPKPVVAVAWEPGTGHRLAAACEDGKVRIWNIDGMAAAGPFLDVEDVTKQAKTFVDDEEWNKLARAVALLRSQVLTPTQKLTVEELQAKLQSVADTRLAEVDISPREITVEQRLELQEVIDIDPIGDAAADALLLMQGKEPKTKRAKKKGAKAVAFAPEQATGPPDAKTGTQDPAAWAPAASPASLSVTFAEEIESSQIEVHLSWNPQAAMRVSLLDAGSSEQQVWVRNRSNSSNPLLIDLSARTPKTREVRVYVAGPCQVDAVCLVDVDGNKHWAATATASSTYSGK